MKTNREHIAKRARAREGLFFAVAGVLLLALVPWALTACSKEEQTPEQVILAELKTMLEAAQKNDPSTIADHISETYTDERGNTRQKVKRTVALTLMRFRNITLVSKNETVKLLDERTAELSFDVFAVAGGAGDIIPTNADHISFKLTLVLEDGVWRIQRAAWKGLRGPFSGLEN